LRAVNLRWSVNLHAVSPLGNDTISLMRGWKARRGGDTALAKRIWITGNGRSIATAFFRAVPIRLFVADPARKSLRMVRLNLVESARYCCR
jgi:hypothetical protein